jgi:hypothetical protein
VKDDKRTGSVMPAERSQALELPFLDLRPRHLLSVLATDSTFSTDYYSP